MKLRIIAIGRTRKGPEASLIEEYRKRLSWPLTIEEMEEKRTSAGTELKAREGELFKAALVQKKGSGRQIVVALDEHGKQLTSREFAGKLEAWRDGGASEVAFLIGGADGLDEKLLKQADFKLSLGAMTWPHLLARVLIVEQIYRAQQILNGHPYHRD